MVVSRRNFFKGISAVIGIAGFTRLFPNNQAIAAETHLFGDKNIGIEWLGHGSYRLTTCKGKTILIDPWISTNPKCPGKYRKKNAFTHVDFILWTHGHVDHFMLPDAKDLIAQYSPKVVAPWELSFFIKNEIPESDCQTFTLGNTGATAVFEEIKITMVEACHSSGAQLTGFEGTNRFVGEAVGYIIEFENGIKLYHSGDTSLMADMKTIIGDFYKPDIAILPIGSVFTMGPHEAAYACSLIRPKIVIPGHYGTFPVLVQSSDRFKQEVRKQAPAVSVVNPKPGQEITV